MGIWRRREIDWASQFSYGAFWLFYLFSRSGLERFILQDALRVLQPASDMNDSLDLSKEADAAVLTQLNEVLGEFFAQKVSTDAAWSRGILGILNS